MSDEDAERPKHCPNYCILGDHPHRDSALTCTRQTMTALWRTWTKVFTQACSNQKKGRVRNPNNTGTGPVRRRQARERSCSRKWKRSLAASHPPKARQTVPPASLQLDRSAGPGVIYAGTAVLNYHAGTTQKIGFTPITGARNIARNAKATRSANTIRSSTHGMNAAAA